MMRSLFSGVAGLKTHQTKMDVIGNNIANVNTIGFKSSDVLFRDVLYQTTANATAATQNAGGTNASQIGLGTKMSSIQVSMNDTGAAQSTGNPYDLMLNGASFFIVNRDGQNYFTKVGAFEVDGAGNLVTSNGYNVMGWQVDPSDPNKVKKDTVSKLSPESVENKTTDPEMTSQMYLTGNVDLTDSDLTSVDGSALSLSLYDSLGYSYTAKFKLTQDSGQADKSLYNLELTSVKDRNNTEILGNDDPSTTTAVEGGYTAKMTRLDEFDNKSGAGGTTIQVKFDPDTGSFEYVGGTGSTKALLEITPTRGDRGDVFTDVVNAEAAEGVVMDFSKLTMYESDGRSTAKMVRGSVEATGGGREMGKLKDVSIDTTGMIYGVYSNGESKLLGQIAVASFANPMAMEAIGDSMYKTTQNSGIFDGIGTSIDETGGTISQSVLEMSNVDLSQEFTEMITTQRGFQANSRIITTSDSMLEELVNLKR